MGMKDNINKKLLIATSDKTELNKKVLKWRKSFLEVDKILSGSKKKEK